MADAASGTNEMLVGGALYDHESRVCREWSMGDVVSGTSNRW